MCFNFQREKLQTHDDPLASLNHLGRRSSPFKQHLQLTWDADSNTGYGAYGFSSSIAHILKPLCCLPVAHWLDLFVSLTVRGYNWLCVQTDARYCED